MNPNCSKWWRMIAAFSLAALLVGCEIETAAYGTVTDYKTGLPIAGAHVAEVAISNKKVEFVCEGYTDSTGHFVLDAGPTSFGGRKVVLNVVAEKDSFWGNAAINNYAEMNIRISKQ